jgi:hypothetical protein
LRTRTQSSMIRVRVRKLAYGGGIAEPAPVSEPSGQQKSEPSAGRAPWGSISREDIVDAAVTIVEAGGYEEMPIRSLAADPGVAPMSLYRHIRDKDDLLNEVVDRAPCARPGWVGPLRPTVHGSSAAPPCARPGLWPHAPPRSGACAATRTRTARSHRTSRFRPGASVRSWRLSRMSASWPSAIQAASTLAFSRSNSSAVMSPRSRRSASLAS